MGLSVWQIVLIIAIVVLIFGPRRIPGLGKSLGEAIRGFRKGLDGSDENLENPENSKQASMAQTPKENNEATHR